MSRRLAWTGCTAFWLALVGPAPADAFSTGPASITLNGEAIPFDSFDCTPDPGLPRRSICTRGDVVAGDGSWTLLSPVLTLDPGGASFGSILEAFDLRNESDVA